MAGEVNVDAMLRRITAKQFRQWEVYNELEPFGEFRDDVRAAQITAMIFNMAVAVKDRKPLTEFLLPWDKVLEQEAAPKRQTPEQQLQIARCIVMAFNAKALEQKA